MTPVVLCLVAYVGRVGPMYTVVIRPSGIGTRWATSASWFNLLNDDVVAASRLHGDPDRWAYAVHASHWVGL